MTVARVENDAAVTVLVKTYAPIVILKVFSRKIVG